MNFTEEEKEFFMKEALKEAQKAAENEEVDWSCHCQRRRNYCA